MRAKGKGRSTRTRKAKTTPALTSEDLGRLRTVLDSQQSLGGGSYPVTVRRLFELGGVPMSDAALKVFVAARNAELFALTAKSSKKEPDATPNALVFFPEDTHSIAGSREIFEKAFEAAKRGGSDIFTSADLKKWVPRALQKAFQAAVDGWAPTGKVPFPGVIVLRRKAAKKTTLYLYRLESYVPATANKQARPVSRGGFASDFAREFERLDRASGNNNYVLLADLRRALPDIDRTEFDRRLKELRLAKLFTLDSPDGRHVRLTSEQLDAGIREGSSNLVYVARR